ncbi:MAG: ABC transporter ATP-binding protein [Alphaproteobacteria bacterium]|nr:ABC transporter ATP-binding protein [Alphaproteobacteria bacterium]
MLQVSDVTCRIGNRAIIERVTFKVPSGGKLALFGSSGSGKTTVLKVLAQTLPPSGGTAVLDGASLISDRGPARGIMVWQNHVLFEHLTVAENVAFGLIARNEPEANIRKKVDEILDKIGLPGFAGRKLAGLSGGERARVAFARAFILQPPLLLLDEVFSNIDVATKALLYGLIDEYAKLPRNHVVFVSHNHDEVVALADHIAILEGGQIKESGALKDVFRSPATIYGALIVPDKLSLSCRVKSQADGRLVVDTGFGELAAERPATETRIRDGADGFLVFAKNDASIARTKGEGTIWGTFLRVLPLTKQRAQVVLRVGDAPLAIEVPQEQAVGLDAGGTIYLRVTGTFFPRG